MNPSTQEQAFDERAQEDGGSVNTFNGDLSPSEPTGGAPYAVSFGGQPYVSLVKGVSNKDATGTTCNYGSQQGSNNGPCMWFYAVFTFVATAPAADAYRPPYFGATKPSQAQMDLWTVATTRTDLLPTFNLASYAGASHSEIPDGNGPTSNALADCATFASTALVQHWNSNGGWLQKMHAILNNFGNPDPPTIARASGDCALWLLDDETFTTNRKKLLAGLLTRGLDVWWMTDQDADVRWEQSGGQGAGRGVLNAVLAAALIPDPILRADVAAMDTERFGDFGFYLSRDANDGQYPVSGGANAGQLGFPLWGAYWPHDEETPFEPDPVESADGYFGEQQNGDVRDPCDQGWIDGGGTDADDAPFVCGVNAYTYALHAPNGWFALGWLLPQFQQFYGGHRRLTDPDDIEASTELAAFHFLDRWEDYAAAGWDRTDLGSTVTAYNGGAWCEPDNASGSARCQDRDFSDEHGSPKTSGVYSGAGSFIYGAADLRDCGYPLRDPNSPCNGDNVGPDGSGYVGLSANCEDGVAGTPFCIGPDCPALTGACSDFDSDGWADRVDSCPTIAEDVPVDPDFDGVDSTCDQCASNASCAYGSLSVTKEGPGFVGAFIHNNIYCGDVELPQYEDCYQDEIAATYGVSISAWPTSGQEADFEGWVGCTVNSQQWVNDHMYGVVTVPANGVHCRAVFVAE